MLLQVAAFAALGGFLYGYAFCLDLYLSFVLCVGLDHLKEFEWSDSWGGQAEWSLTYPLALYQYVLGLSSDGFPGML